MLRPIYHKTILSFLRYNKIMKQLRLKTFRSRRIVAVILALAGLIGVIIGNPASYESIVDQTANAEPSTANTELNDASNNPNPTTQTNTDAPLAREILEKLEIKGRAPKTGYKREEFYKGWPDIDGCSLRQRILKRELGASATLADDNCTVISGEFDEPYTGSHLVFYQKSDLSNGLQIDHVVALSDAWQKGAQYLSAEVRYQLATDPLNLLAVDSKTNQGKSDGDAATWLPPNKAFRCQYVARQISVKYKYGLWVTPAEHDAMTKVLTTCPNESTVGIAKSE